MDNPYKYSKKLERRTASLYVQNTGCQQCRAGDGWGPGIRDHFLLHTILSGRGTCIIDSRKYALESGDSFLVYPDTTVHYYADSQEPWEYIWVGFNGMDAERYVELTDFSRENPVLPGGSGHPLRRQAHKENPLPPIRGAADPAHPIPAPRRDPHKRRRFL